MIRVCVILILVAAACASAQTSRYWVFFSDKGVVPGQEMRALDAARSSISPRSIERRLKNGAQTVTPGDLPVHARYIEQVREIGATIRTSSKWLNAVSLEASKAEIDHIRALPFVREVRRFSQRLALDLPERGQNVALDSAEYGNSYRQFEICRIPELHARGLSGEGVLLCMLDTGFETMHESLNDLDYLAMRDFINNDSIVTNEPGEDDPGQFMHGTLCLSTAAGVDSGNIIGPAFGARWMLAKTEYVPTETAVEEDYYVAGMEWADSAGADITSSSLGYIDWYTQDQMDGRTTVVAQAATEAQRRGILVVTAQGNERGSPWGTVISPADADSILAIGGCDSLRGLYGASSPGPTADGRIKPDCAAQGLDVFCANAFDLSGYFRISGTSLATPIVAGVAALVMEANPDWTAQQVRHAIMMTASQAQSPDNDFGYGIVDAVAAADYEFSSFNGRALLPTSTLLTAYPNPANGIMMVAISVDRAQRGALSIYDLLGRKVAAFDRDYVPGANNLAIPVDAFASGKYFLSFSGATESQILPIVILK